MPPRLRSIPLVLFTLFLALSSGTARAMLLPIEELEGHWFPVRVEGIQVASMRLRAVPIQDPARVDPGRFLWLVDAELWLRNVTASSRTLTVGVADDPALSDRTVVFVDGVRVPTESTTLRYEPRYEAVHRSSVRRLAVTLEPGALRVIRLRAEFAATVDERGLHVLSLPTHVLQTLASKVDRAFLELEVPERALGLQSTLSGSVLYDDPENQLSWFAHDWQPRIPLRLSWLGAWAALLVVAEVEACPAPWEVLRLMAQGRPETLRAYLAAFDTATTEFCAALPLVIRGYPFPSERLRRQFGEIRLSRYLPSAGPEERLYRVNEGFRPELLTEVEQVYRSALHPTAEPLR